MLQLFSSTQDIFWFALAIVTLWCGLMLGLVLYHIAMSMRDIRTITANVKSKLEFVDSIIALAQSKLEGAASFIPPLMKQAETVVHWWKGPETERKSSRRKKK
jgi:hypothetical protein